MTNFSVFYSLTLLPNYVSFCDLIVQETYYPSTQLPLYPMSNLASLLCIWDPDFPSWKEFWKRQEDKLGAQEIRKNNTVIITTHYLFLKLDLSESYYLELNTNRFKLSLCRGNLKQQCSWGRTLIRKEK